MASLPRLLRSSNHSAVGQAAPFPAPASEDEIRRIGLVNLSALALVVGVVTGFGAVGFRDLIGLIHNLLFLGTLSFHYDANLFTPPSSVGSVRHPGAGGGRRRGTFLVTNFAPEARGHGVPEVMDAIYYKGGVIRPVVAVVKSLASAIAIGSGAAVGREGPIIQIGSALGSTLGPDRAHAAGRADHPGGGRRRRGHRRHLQHADRRRHVRDRADDARGQRPHLPAGRARHRHRDLHRPLVLRPAAGVRRAASRPAERRRELGGSSLCLCTRCWAPSSASRPRASSAACICSKTCSTRSRSATRGMCWACCWSAC